MYELYSNYIPGEDVITARSNPPPTADAHMFLASMTRIVVDIAEAFNANFASFNLTAVAPSYPFIMYRAGMHMLINCDVSSDEIVRNFNSIRRCCWYFSHRWLMACQSPCKQDNFFVS